MSLRRTLTLIGLAAAVFTVKAEAGWFGPRLTHFESCTEELVVSGADLLAASRTSRLFFMRTEAGDRSLDERLFGDMGIDGLVLAWRTKPTDPPILKDAEVRFTGDVLKRKTSPLERFFARARDSLYYWIELDGVPAALLVDALNEPLLGLCEQAKQA